MGLGMAAHQLGGSILLILGVSAMSVSEKETRIAEEKNLVNLVTIIVLSGALLRKDCCALKYTGAAMRKHAACGRVSHRSQKHNDRSARIDDLKETKGLLLERGHQAFGSRDAMPTMPRSGQR